MNKPYEPNVQDAAGEELWQRDYAAGIGADRAVTNRSGVAIKPLYTPRDWSGESYADDVGYPGQPPYTRGIYPTMHRGRTWTQRQLIGLSTPADYNARLLGIIGQGATAVSLIPCNSVFRGYDMDEVDAELLGTCGVVVNTVDHMDTCLDGVDLGRMSCAMNDPSPFTLHAFLLATAKRRGVGWDRIRGTSNQSDYLSHYVANHMFFRLALPARAAGAARPHRVLQPARSAVEPDVGRRPAHAAGRRDAGRGDGVHLRLRACRSPTTASRAAWRPTTSCRASPSSSTSRCRSSRRSPASAPGAGSGPGSPASATARRTRGAGASSSTRRPPASTSPGRSRYNNIARVTVQAMAGILGGLQSLHTDAYDEALSCPTEFGARIAVATQNILREEAHLTDVIDPLGGSYYVETLTDEMEAAILRSMQLVADAGGMYDAVAAGVVQRQIGESARRFQESVDSGAQTVVGVNAYRTDEDRSARPALPKPDAGKMQRHLADFAAYKAARSQGAVAAAHDALARAANDPQANVFAAVVAAAEAGCTHGEICGTLRREMGFGHVQALV